MNSTYKATVRSHQIEWDDGVPEYVRDEVVLRVLVTIVKQPVEAGQSRGRRMAEALKRLAGSGGVPSIPNPKEWQTEQRQERDILGRR
jgi:hypothetical protein